MGIEGRRYRPVFEQFDETRNQGGNTSGEESQLPTQKSTFEQTGQQNNLNSDKRTPSSYYDPDDRPPPRLVRGGSFGNPLRSPPLRSEKRTIIDSTVQYVEGNLEPLPQRRQGRTDHSPLSGSPSSNKPSTAR